MSWHVRVIANRYADSVRLMGIARSLREREGVARCELAMGTPANLELLAGLGVTAEAGPADIVIAVEAAGEGAEEALAEAERALVSLSPGDADGDRSRPRPLSLALAGEQLQHANVALISVPGDYAGLEAHRALSAGMHVFLFSDHVPLEAEVELKRRGADLGLLVMGPECGTAMLGGIGLGFANVVRPGPVGIVAAAGTGAQEAACLLDAAGTGVSQIVGLGGRDLSDEVGGIMCREGMRLLAEDEGTETVLLVSKATSRDVLRAVGDAVPAGLHVVAALVGWDGGDAPFEVHPTLEAAAAAVAGAPAPDVSRLERELEARRGLAAGRSLLGSSRAARSRTRRRRSSSRGSGRSPATSGRAAAAAADMRSSTSARTSTRRGALTRWWTSTCGGRCSTRRPPTRRSAACCSTWCSVTPPTPTPRAGWPTRSSA